MHRRAFPQELGVGDRHDIAPAQRPRHEMGRADRHGRLVDDDGLRQQVRADLCRRLFDVARVCSTARGGGGRQAQECELRLLDRLLVVRRERQAVSVDAAPEQLGQVLLREGRLTPLQRGHAALRDVTAHHVVAHVCQAHRCGEPDIAGADDRDLRHGRKLTGWAQRRWCRRSPDRRPRWDGRRQLCRWGVPVRSVLDALLPGRPTGVAPARRIA